MKTKALKHFCSGPPQYGLNISPDHYVGHGIRLLRTSDIARGGVTESDDAVYLDPEDVSPEYLLTEGDLLFSRSGTLGRCLRVRGLQGPTTFAGFLVRFRVAPQHSGRFIEYAAQSRVFSDAIAADSIQSTIANFNAERYAGIALPVCDRIREDHVADFLDAETARIDQLIAAKQVMIDRLGERWRALVNHRMHELETKHGSIQLRHLVRCLDGRRIPLSSEERSYRPGPYPYYGASGVVDNVDAYLFDETLVLLGEDGAQLGDPSSPIAQVVSGKIWVNNHAHVLRPLEASPDFLALYLNTFDRVRFISGGTREKITQDDMNRIRVPDLLLSEQHSEAQRLRQVRERCDQIAAEITQQIKLLREHREALITAAVTGELEVA